MSHSALDPRFDLDLEGRVVTGKPPKIQAKDRGKKSRICGAATGSIPSIRHITIGSGLDSPLEADR